MAKKKFRKRLQSFKRIKFYELQDKAFKYLGMFCTILGVVILFVLLGDVLIEGLNRISFDFLTGSTSGRAEEAGIYNAIIGSLWMMGLTALIAFPVGIAAGLYLQEYGKRSKMANFIEINIANLAGVPSIIYGLLGLEIFARTLMMGKSLLTGACTLSLLILPIIIVSTREALKAVPYSLREASFGLGASKWQTIWYQVLPASIPGILTGGILAISRAVGETAPLIVVGASAMVTYAPASPMDDYTVLPIQIFNWVTRPQPEFVTNAAGTIIVLLAITFLMNAVAVFFRHKAQKKIKW